MIGVILSAGMGTRLMPLTKEIPKPLLKVNGMTLLERMMKNLMAADIKDFIVIVGYNKDKVIDLAPELEEKYSINIKILENENMMLQTLQFQHILQANISKKMVPTISY